MQTELAAHERKIDMDIGWDDRLWAIAVPLIILAVDAARRAAIHLLLSWKAAAWWNQVVMNTHDKKHDEAENEQRQLDERLDAALAALHPESLRHSGSPTVTYIAQELTRLRQRLDVMRIEDHARYDAETARSQFSDFRIVWLWLRNRGNPKVRLDGGTARRFMERADLEARAQTRVGTGTAPLDSAGSVGEIPSRPTAPPSAPSPAIAMTTQGMIVLPAPTVLITEQLEHLAVLRERGVLTPEEFAKLKAVLLDF